MPETIDLTTGEILPAVVDVSDVVVPMDAFQFTPTALVFTAEPSYEEWDWMGKQLQHTYQCFGWWIGDWLLGGEALFGDRYLQAIHLTGNALQTLRNKQWVCRKIPPKRRRADLSFSHHAAVAGKDEKEQEHWLDMAEREDWTCEELRDAIKGLPFDEPPVEDVADEAGMWLSADDLAYLRQCLEQIAVGVANTPLENTVRAALELLEETP